jgi:hypothetical protein
MIAMVPIRAVQEIRVILPPSSVAPVLEGNSCEGPAASGDSFGEGFGESPMISIIKPIKERGSWVVDEWMASQREGYDWLLVDVKTRESAFSAKVRCEGEKGIQSYPKLSKDSPLERRELIYFGFSRAEH